MTAFVDGREIAVNYKLDADEETWGKPILAAIRELKEKSPEAKKFFEEKK